MKNEDVIGNVTISDVKYSTVLSKYYFQVTLPSGVVVMKSIYYDSTEEADRIRKETVDTFEKRGKDSIKKKTTQDKGVRYFTGEDKKGKTLVVSTKIYFDESEIDEVVDLMFPTDNTPQKDE